MQRTQHGAECHISGRPYTRFRWKPGSDARLKSTIICQEVAKAKNVCQVCLLDLKYNLPVQARDTVQGNVVEEVPDSEVGLEFQLALRDSRGDLGVKYLDEKPSDDIARIARTTPYYKRNRAHICSFFVKGTCNRGAECPFRHEMPETGPLATQNIRDRYYGVNDPVAQKMLGRLGERVVPPPPEDTSIVTLFVGNVEPNWGPEDLQPLFEAHGTVTSVKVIHNKNCAFVNFATRAEAEAAIKALHDRLLVHGTRCKLSWGKPQAPREPHAGGPPPYAMMGPHPGQPGGPPMGGPPMQQQQQPGGVPDFFGVPRPQHSAYPSMDPTLMGSALAPTDAAPDGSGPPASKRARGPEAPGMLPPGPGGYMMPPPLFAPRPMGPPPGMGPPPMHYGPPGMGPPGGPPQGYGHWGGPPMGMSPQGGPGPRPPPMGPPGSMGPPPTPAGTL